MTTRLRAARSRAGPFRRLLPVGVLGVARRGVDGPHCAVLVIDDVPDAAAAAHFVLLLLHLPAIVAVGCRAAAKPVLAAVIGARAQVGP